jgi:hypothetical protein
MFSVPIIHYEIENWEVNKKRILDALPPECPEECDDGVFTDFYVNILNELPEYADTIIDIIKPYLLDAKQKIRLSTDNSKLEFINMWYQKYYRGVSHSPHNHGHGGWSSIIYVEFDPEVHQPTQFTSPFNDILSGELVHFIPPIKEGDMVIFPSIITHEALPNMSDIRRTIVSYNLYNSYYKKAELLSGLSGN